MPISRTGYVPSQTLYALKLDTYKSFTGSNTIHLSFSSSFEVIWTKTLKGVSSISKGFLSHTSRNYLSFEDFLKVFDSRYGGRPIAKWDGTYMNAPETSLDEMNYLAAELEPTRLNLPEVPDGYGGWFKLS